MEETETSRDKPRALVVDDEPDMLDFIERVLRRRFVVTLAHSAEEALPKLRSGEFDLVVTDNQMLHLSGLEMLAQLGDSNPGLVRIVLSGLAEDPTIAQAIDDGTIHGYIVKPVDSGELLGSVEQAYRSHRARSA